MYNGTLKLKRPDQTTYSTLSLAPADGVLISTIRGITSVSANLSTAVRSTGVGETIRGYTIKGKPLVVQGRILDDDKPLKDELLSIVQAGNEGTLELDCQTVGVSSASKTQYCIDVVVKDAPDISQEKHSKFSFTLYAPIPYWRAKTKTSITGFVNNVSKPTAGYLGNVESDYTLTFKASASMTKATFTMGGRTLILNFSTAVTSGTAVVFTRKENGRVVLTVGGVEHNEYIDLTNTTLWMLPVRGPLGATLKVEGASGIALSSSKLEYYTRYGSVMTWGDVDNGN